MTTRLSNVFSTEELENADEKMNYGIYVNGGLLVETCSINILKNHSNLIIQ